MDEEIFLDSDLLRDHAVQLRSQRDYARELCDVLHMISLTISPEFQDTYNHLMEDVQNLERYYSSMATVIENLGSDTERLSIKIRDMLQDNLDSNPIRTIFLDI